MPNSSLAEVYFIVVMMLLILIICGVSVYFFFKTFYKEKKLRENEIRRKNKLSKQKSETKSR